MKFRPKLDRLWPFTLFVCLMSAFLSIALISSHGYLAAFWGTASLIALAGGGMGSLGVYWETSPDFLIVRRLWRRREIPWSEVREIRWLDRTSGILSVDIGHRVEDYDWLDLEPSDSDGFIAESRKYAPQAKFEL